MIRKTRNILNINKKSLRAIFTRKAKMIFKLSNSSNNLFKYDPLAVNLVRNRLLIDPSVYKVKNLVHNKNENTHNSPASKEWTNSVYTYNKNYSKPLPATLNITNNLLKGYLNMSPVINGKKSNVNAILEKKLTLNRVFVSKAEVKHTNDKINLTVYIYNKKKETLKLKLKKIMLFLKKKRVKLSLKNDIAIFLKTKNILESKILKLKNEILNTINDNTLKGSLNEKKALNDKLDDKVAKNFEWKIVWNLLDLINKNNNILYIYYTRVLLLNNNIFKNWFMLSLKKSLEKLYNKKVELNIVNQKYLYFNSDILLKAISTRVRDRNNAIAKELFRVLSKINIPIYNYFLKNKPVNIKDKGVSAYLRNDIFNLIKYKHISGIRIEAAGRLTKRLTAARSLSKVKILGCLTNYDEKFNNKRTLAFRGSIKPNLQYTIAHSKTRNGAFGLKGWVNGK